MWLLENFRTMHVAYIVFLGQRYSRISSERTFVFSWLCISWPDSADHSSNFTFLSKKASLEQCKFDYQVLANYYSFQTSRVSCGCSLGFVQSFCEELSYFRPVLSPHSQSGMHGLLTLLPILKASWVCVLGSTFTCGHPSHPPPPAHAASSNSTMLDFGASWPASSWVCVGLTICLEHSTVQDVTGHSCGRR